jgi:hypothetical protein
VVEALIKAGAPINMQNKVSDLWHDFSHIVLGTP